MNHRTLVILLTVFAARTAHATEVEPVEVHGDAELLAALTAIRQDNDGIVYVEVKRRSRRALVRLAAEHPELRLEVIESGNPTARTECRVRIGSRGDDIWALYPTGGCDHEPDAEVAGEAGAGGENPVRVCLSDGQRLMGAELTQNEDPLKLELAGAFISIPRSSQRVECRSLHPTQGRASKVRMFRLPGEQWLYGKEGGESAEGMTLLLLNHDPIFVPEQLVLEVKVPDADDRVVVSARSSKARTVVPIVVGSVLGAAAASGLFIGLIVSVLP